MTSMRAAPLTRLAWRNLWRQRRRTVLLIVVVAYVTMTNVFLWGYADGFLESVVSGNARFVSAPVLITTPEYRDDPDPEHALPDLDFLSAVEAAPRVRAAAPRLEFPVLVRSPYASEGLLARGVDPAREPRVSNIPGSVAEGRMVEAPGEIVLGSRLAERLDSRLGERVVVDTAGRRGPQAAGLVVVGLVRSGVAAVDDAAALVHIDDARRLTGVATATGVALDVPRGAEDTVARSVEPLLPAGVRAYGVADLVGFLRVEVINERVQMAIILLLFSLFGALAVTSTILVSVIERTREFGVISALGLSPLRLARLVILEAVMSSAIGWAIGLVLGYGIIIAMSRWNVLGPVFASYGEAFRALGMGGELYTSTSAAYGLYATATIVLAAALTAVGPARRVRRLSPARAMRVE